MNLVADIISILDADTKIFPSAELMQTNTFGKYKDNRAPRMHKIDEEHYTERNIIAKNLLISYRIKGKWSYYNSCFFYLFFQLSPG